MDVEPLATRQALRQRLSVVRRFRQALAADPSAFVAALRELPTRRDDAESLSAEVLPLAAACAWLEDNAEALLRPRRLGGHLFGGKPWWLWGVSSEIRRDPVGNVLVIGPGNFPLFLPGVQALQALTAGNRVWVKPSPTPGARQVMRQLAAALEAAGMPAESLTVLDPDPAALGGVNDLFATFDKAVLTGSEDTGRAVQARCAEHGIPCVMELSGCDSVHVLQTADLGLAARCIAFGLMLNNSATCIAPRRVFVKRDRINPLVELLVEQLGGEAGVSMSDATARRFDGLLDEWKSRGVTVRCGGPSRGGNVLPTVAVARDPFEPGFDGDVFAPLLLVSPVDDDVAGLNAVEASSGYRLGAAVFGAAADAERFARSLDVGCVVINDCVVPTADPRLPFSGRGRSGFGATRGEAGLLEMTRVKAIASRRRNVYPHLRPTGPHTAGMLRRLLEALYAPGVARRVQAAVGLLKLYRRQAADHDADQESPR